MMMEFGPSRAAQQRRILTILLAAVFAIILLLIGFASGATASGAWAVILGLELLPLGLLLLTLRRYRAARGRRIVVYDDRMTFQVRGRQVALRWTDFTAYESRVRRNWQGVRLELVLVTPEVEIIVRPDYERAVMLSTILMARVSEALLANHLETLRGNQALIFNDITLTAELISVGERHLRWDQITDLSTAGEQIVLKADGEQLALPQVPQRDVLALLVQTLLSR